jgi:hypothetical protein
VPTVNTNIALIDRIELVTAGSGGVAAGTITLFTDNAGAGSAIASIATGDLRTYMAQAYVPNGRRLHVSDVVLDSGEAATVESAFRLRVLPYGGVSNPAEAAVGNGWRALGLSGVRQLDGGGRDLAVVSGPARVRLYVAPGAVTGTTQRGEFGYYLS